LLMVTGPCWARATDEAGAAVMPQSARSARDLEIRPGQGRSLPLSRGTGPAAVRLELVVTIAGARRPRPLEARRAAGFRLETRRTVPGRGSVRRPRRSPLPPPTGAHPPARLPSRIAVLGRCFLLLALPCSSGLPAGSGTICASSSRPAPAPADRSKRVRTPAPLQRQFQPGDARHSPGGPTRRTPAPGALETAGWWSA